MADSVVRMPKNVSLLITYKCTARCKMCCWSCSPERTEEMSLKDIKQYVDQAREVVSVEQISLTGGEPFIDFEKLLKAVAYISTCGFEPKVITNCFWATNYEKSEYILNKLVKNGLKSFRVSTDEFHEEFVPLENVCNALKAAKNLGLDINIGSTKKADQHKNYGEILDNTVGLEGIDYMESNLVHEGRAKKLPIEYFDYRQEKLKTGCNVIERPLITPHGDMYPCCMIPLSKNLTLGNIKKGMKLSDVLHESLNSTLFTALALYGPLRLYDRFLSYTKDKKKGNYKKMFVTMCEVCNWLLSHKNASLFMEMLERSTIEIFAAKTIVESDERYRKYL